MGQVKKETDKIETEREGSYSSKEVEYWKTTSSINNAAPP